MTKKIEDKLAKIPVVNLLVSFCQKIKIPGFQGMSLYDILEMYFIAIVNGALTSRAAAIAFSFFMAIFPFFLFILTLIPFVEINNFQEDFMAFIYSFLPPSTAESVDTVILDIANNRYEGLLSFGVLASIFLMTNGVNAIFAGFEYSYHVKENRNMFKQYFVALGVSLILSTVLLTTVAVIVYIELGIDHLKVIGWDGDVTFWQGIGRASLLISMIYTSVTILYNFGVKDIRNRAFFSPGAIMTTLLTLVMFYVFGIYVEKFAQYNQLYGSIGTLLIFMMFIWVNCIILLLGFELNASLNRLESTHTRIK